MSKAASNDVTVLDARSCCRICFGEEPELLAPCKCSGSVKYVHESCARTWILTSSSDVARAACELCKEPYRLQIDWGRTCSVSSMRSTTYCIFVPLASLALGMLSLLLYILILRVINQMADGLQASTLSLLIVCVAALSVVLYLFMCSFKSACCRTVTRRIRVLNYEEKAGESRSMARVTPDLNV